MLLETLNEVEENIKKNPLLRELHELPILRKLWNLICELPYPKKLIASQRYFTFLNLLVTYQNEALGELLTIEQLLREDGYDALIVNQVMKAISLALYG